MPTSLISKVKILNQSSFVVSKNTEREGYCMSKNQIIEDNFESGIVKQVDTLSERFPMVDKTTLRNVLTKPCENSSDVAFLEGYSEGVYELLEALGIDREEIILSLLQE